MIQQPPGLGAASVPEYDDGLGSAKLSSGLCFAEARGVVVRGAYGASHVPGHVGLGTDDSDVHGKLSSSSSG